MMFWTGLGWNKWTKSFTIVNKYFISYICSISFDIACMWRALVYYCFLHRRKLVTPGYLWFIKQIYVVWIEIWSQKIHWLYRRHIKLFWKILNLCRVLHKLYLSYLGSCLLGIFWCSLMFKNCRHFLSFKIILPKKIFWTMTCIYTFNWGVRA